MSTSFHDFSIKFGYTLKFEIKLQEKDLRENSNPVYIETQNFAYDRFGMNLLRYIYIYQVIVQKKNSFQNPTIPRRFREFKSYEVDQTCRQLQ